MVIVPTAIMVSIATKKVVTAVLRHRFVMQESFLMSNMPHMRAIHKYIPGKGYYNIKYPIQVILSGPIELHVSKGGKNLIPY